MNCPRDPFESTFPLSTQIDYGYVHSLTSRYGQLPNPSHYPLQMFPPLLQAAILEVSHQTEAPLPLVSASALGALSLSLQARLDVRAPHGQTTPCSLYLITLAESGERKTTCDHFFMQGLRAVHDRLHAQGCQDFDVYQKQLMAWKKRPREEVNLPAPDKPWRINMISSDVTPAAIRHSLHEYSPFGSLMSNEAGTVLHGRGAADLYLLNTLWDGASIDEGRRTTGLIRVSAPRFTMSLMLQPQVFLSFRERRAGLAEPSGFLPRALVSWPISTQGSRFGLARTLSDRAITQLQAQLGHWLEQSWQSFLDGHPRHILECTQQATDHWHQFGHYVEQGLAPGQVFSDIRAFASKASQHALRLAALFSQFQPDPSCINLDSMQGASSVINWYLHEYRRLLGPVPALSQARLDMMRMGDFLANTCQSCGTALLQQVFVTEYARPLFSSKAHVKAVLSMLQNTGQIIMGRSAIDQQDIVACVFLDPNAQNWVIPAGARWQMPAQNSPTRRATRCSSRQR